MPVKKRPLVTANVSPQTLEILKERAAERGLSLRDYCASVLTSVCETPSDPDLRAPEERSVERTGERSGLGLPGFVPVLIRMRDDARDGASAQELERNAPPNCGRGDSSTDQLPPDPKGAAETFARELQLVRKSWLWRQALQDGLLNEELAARAD